MGSRAPHPPGPIGSGPPRPRLLVVAVARGWRQAQAHDLPRESALEPMSGLRLPRTRHQTHPSPSPSVLGAEMILFVGVPPPTRLRQALLQPAGVVAAWAVARRRGTLFVPLYTHFVPLYTQLCLFSAVQKAQATLCRLCCAGALHTPRSIAPPASHPPLCTSLASSETIATCQPQQPRGLLVIARDGVSFPTP